MLILHNLYKNLNTRVASLCTSALQAVKQRAKILPPIVPQAVVMEGHPSASKSLRASYRADSQVLMLLLKQPLEEEWVDMPYQFK